MDESLTKSLENLFNIGKIVDENDLINDEITNDKLEKYEIYSKNQVDLRIVLKVDSD